MHTVRRGRMGAHARDDCEKTGQTCFLAFVNAFSFPLGGIHALAATVLLGSAVTALPCAVDCRIKDGQARLNGASVLGGFLSSRELDDMLSDLAASPWPEGTVWGCVLYIGKKWTPFDYVCPECGTRTHYPEIVQSSLWGDGYASFLTNLHQTVEFLRSRRLDVCVDERILCQSCRVAMKIPDRHASCAPTGCMGRVTSSGAASRRSDLFEHLKWRINGREIDIASDDCILLRTFFSGRRVIPGRSTNAALKQRHKRLVELLGSDFPSSNPLSEMPDVEVDYDGIDQPRSWTNNDVTVESDL